MENNYTIELQDNISSFAVKYNLEEADVRKYAESMQDSNLGGAAYAFQDIRRKYRLDNSNESFVQFSHRFAPIKEKLYEEFGNIDKLRDEAIRITMEERNVMEAARRRIEEETANERGRLQEFQDMSDEQLDSEYFMAIDENNEPRMRDLVNEAARRKCYEDKESSYQGVGAWVAPADPGYENAEARRADVEEYSLDVNIEDIAKGYSPQPDDYFTNLKAYGKDTPEGKESAEAINKAINEIRSTGNIPLVKVHRAVPIDVKENTLRNGDWVSLSRKYAEIHGNSRLEGKYRIIEQEVPANKLWWDGNDSNEWGYDDGKDYRYKNIENNRKLNDLITRDDNGNIIPLSQRFDSRNDDVRFRFIGEKGAANLDRAEEATFRLDNLVIAREMEYVGKDPLFIKKATGWERGADSLWKYEENDFKINEKVHFYKSVGGHYSLMLSELNGDDQLFDEYPELSGISVTIKNGNPERASLDENKMEIIGDFIIEGKLKVKMIGVLESLLAHEIQHAIQDREGFARGGSPEEFKDVRSEVIRDLNFFTNGDFIKGSVITTSESVREALLKVIPFTDFTLYEAYKDKLQKVAVKYGYRDLAQLIDNFDCLPSSLEQYYKLSGEVEARNVQSRIDMSMEERRMSLAQMTEDVRREDQIFLENSFSGSTYSSKAELIPIIEPMSDALHTSVYIINDIHELPDGKVKRNIEAGHNIKGWFAPATNQVTLYLPNIMDPDDAWRTVFHEVVGHYGLRKMFGEHFDIFLDNVYNNASVEIQGRIMYATHGDPSKRLVATEEYLSKLAERGFTNIQERSLWKKIKLAFIDMLRQSDVKLGFKLHDNDLRGILYKSYQKQIRNDFSNNSKIATMDDNNEKIKLVVYKEHTLGYILPELPDSVQILHSSPLKGANSTTNLQDNYHINNLNEIRLASEKDFDDFRVDFKGYDDKQIYEYNDVGNAKEIISVGSPDEEFRAAVEGEEYIKLSQLKDAGYLPTKEIMQSLSASFSESTMVAVQKIFGIDKMEVDACVLQVWTDEKPMSSPVMSVKDNISID
ncbi:LPD23 domain-containing protein [Bacteroides ovatus]|uniref:LPD23 domain-containing protein n=1 Tax=Bacteroides ovatus TaxID=28116 RepID=UPI00202FDA6C|nr:LPD23 domain-containing protein [Bacteroides ovatus]MCM1722582.1 hypothetical protein [Bacteroides ovatus]MCM1757688.1 hypothetical protein [Bacteroides ovatus]MCM1868697.1 hypothetical protein [Bacteroides ovatus]MCM1910936.1 hypothetical protein [Bacteroides ovatus]